MPKHGPREEVFAYFLSDVHLGAKNALVKAERIVLNRYQPDYIIVDGDLIDDSNLSPRGLLSCKSRKLEEIEDQPDRIPRSHLDLVEDINGRAKHGCHVIFIPGNHDHGIWRLLAYFIGASVHQEFILEYNGKKIYVTHGDFFDTFYHERRIISEIAMRLYELIINKFGPLGHKFGAILKKCSKYYTGAINCVAEGATRRAAELGCSVAICGHTHHAEYRVLNGVHYFNLGCGTEDPISVMTIGELGIRIHFCNAEGKEIRIMGPYPIF